jgi:hypothetical protein
MFDMFDVSIYLKASTSDAYRTRTKGIADNIHETAKLCKHYGDARAPLPIRRLPATRRRRRVWWSWWLTPQITADLLTI